MPGPAIQFREAFAVTTRAFSGKQQPKTGLKGGFPLFQTYINYMEFPVSAPAAADFPVLGFAGSMSITRFALSRSISAPFSRPSWHP